MAWPAPRPGLVIRYSYLWTREAQAGRAEGVKDRPCAIVLAVVESDERTRVIVLPITHTAPQPPDAGLELSNDFAWPGPDLRPAPGRGPDSVAYGFLPPRVFLAVRQRFLARVRAKQAGLIQRDT